LTFSLTHPSADMLARSAPSHPIAASGGVLVRLDWPALTPALTEIRLFASAAGSAGLSQRTMLRRHSRLGRVVAVQFTPTGALPAGAPHRGLSDA
jgi:hypothetical protein